MPSDSVVEEPNSAENKVLIAVVIPVVAVGLAIIFGWSIYRLFHPRASPVDGRPAPSVQETFPRITAFLLGQHQGRRPPPRGRRSQNRPTGSFLLPLWASFTTRLARSLRRYGFEPTSLRSQGRPNPTDIEQGNLPTSGSHPVGAIDEGFIEVVPVGEVVKPSPGPSPEQDISQVCQSKDPKVPSVGSPS